MTRRGRASTTLWGILSILAGGLMAEGGVREVIAYWPRGEMAALLVGTFGAIGSVVLLTSGVAFLTRRTFGRPNAIAGALAMIPVHLAGWWLGFVGISGGLLGVVYPALLLFVLRARPNLGAPAQPPATTPVVRPPHQDHSTRRVASATC
jgi:hypothetical protein